MLKSVKIKKGANLALIAVVLIVWSLIGSYLFKYFTAGNDVPPEQISVLDSTEKTIAEDKLRDTNTVYLPALTRNPFRFVASKPEKAPQTTLPPPPRQPAFRFKIQGIMLRQNNRTVVIEDETNKRMVYLKEGETYLDLSIMKITPREVTYKQNTEKLTYGFK